MSKLNFALVIFILITASVSCKWFKPGASQEVNAGSEIDFTTPARGLDVKVELDKKHTSSGSIGQAGGTVSLISGDGSKFTLEVPANALDAETTITMIAVKTLDGAPLDTNTPAAVQLEPSGLHFNEFLTLTIVPAKEIPIEKQVMFGYEGKGEDYHLMPIDSKSKEIKIKLIDFSGGGVGSASDVAWAANLAIQAREAKARLQHKVGIWLRGERMGQLIEGKEGVDPDNEARMKRVYDQYEDDVVRKQMAAAELDCKHARKALHTLIDLGRGRQLAGFPEGRIVQENYPKFLEIAKKCRRPFRVAASSNNVSFTGQICSLDLPFSIDGKFPGGSAKTSFQPGNAANDISGTTIVTGGGGSCTHTGGGEFTVTHNEDGSSSIEWTTTDTISCPMFTNTRTVTFKLPLQPAPDLSCP